MSEQLLNYYKSQLKRFWNSLTSVNADWTLAEFANFATALGLIGIFATMMFNNTSDKQTAAQFWGQLKDDYQKVWETLNTTRNESITIRIEKSNSDEHSGITSISGFSNNNNSGETTIYLDDGSYWKAIERYWYHAAQEWAITSKIGSGKTAELWDIYYRYVIFNAMNRTEYSRTLCYLINGRSTIGGNRSEFKSDIAKLYAEPEVTSNAWAVWGHETSTFGKHNFEPIECLKPDNKINLSNFQENLGFSKSQHRYQFESQILKILIKEAQKKGIKVFISRSTYGKTNFKDLEEIKQLQEIKELKTLGDDIEIYTSSDEVAWPYYESTQKKYLEVYISREASNCNSKENNDSKTKNPCKKISISKAILANPRNYEDARLLLEQNTEKYFLEFYPKVSPKYKSRKLVRQAKRHANN